MPDYKPREVTLPAGVTWKSLRPADRLKYVDSTLYYDMLHWKDTHTSLFAQIITPNTYGLSECKESELLAVAMLTIQQLIKP
jgi:hypothetical protein